MSSKLETKIQEGSIYPLTVNDITCIVQVNLILYHHKTESFSAYVTYMHSGHKELVSLKELEFLIKTYYNEPTRSS